MWIESLYLKDFRNIPEARVTWDAGLNVIFGDNAQGKTNLLEAVFYFGAGKSHREAKDPQLVRYSMTHARMEAEIVSEGRRQTLAVTLQPPRKAMWCNEVRLKSPRELVGKLPCVLFGPEELDLVRAGALTRRRFLNLALCQLSPAYLAALSEYNKLIAHKNKLLHQETGWEELLPVFNARLSLCGATLIAARYRFMEDLRRLAERFHAEISVHRAPGTEREIAPEPETLSLQYKTVSGLDPSAPREELARAFLNKLMENAQRERAARVSLYGPHRDDIEAMLSGRALKLYGSQGQRRTAALAMKLAEREIFTGYLGEPPVLLLDDVFSELDVHRRDHLVRRVTQGQVILTGCQWDAAPPKGLCLRVQGGEVMADNREKRTENR